MPNIIVYNNRTNRMERGFFNLNDPMPYAGPSLTVREFRGSSRSDLLWTDVRAMEAWRQFRTYWGRPIYVGYAFKRIGEGGHSDQSQHYAGMSFDVGQNLADAERSRLRNAAIQSGIWSYVEPASLTPTWVHFDKRQGTPACPTGGYPLLREGSRGTYAATLQDALQTVGIPAVAIDGIFGPGTKKAVQTFQRENGLAVDGIVGCNTWRELTKKANGALR